MGIRIRIRQIGATTGKTISLPASYGELLTIAKTKLGLPSAAQRVFTKEGDEIDDADFGTIQNDDVLYISCGEAFKPPAEATGAQAPTSTHMHRDQGSARRQMQEQLLGSDHSVPVVPTRPPLESLIVAAAADADAAVAVEGAAQGADDQQKAVSVLNGNVGRMQKLFRMMGPEQ